MYEVLAVSSSHDISTTSPCHAVVLIRTMSPCLLVSRLDTRVSPDPTRLPVPRGLNPQSVSLSRGWRHENHALTASLEDIGGQ